MLHPAPCPTPPVTWYSMHCMCTSRYRCAPSQVRPVVAKYLGYFQAESSQGGITSGSQWLVWRFESDSTLADACDGALGPFPVRHSGPGDAPSPETHTHTHTPSPPPPRAHTYTNTHTHVPCLARPPVDARQGVLGRCMQHSTNPLQRHCRRGWLTLACALATTAVHRTAWRASCWASARTAGTRTSARWPPSRR